MGGAWHGPPMAEKKADERMPALRHVTAVAFGEDASNTHRQDPVLADDEVPELVRDPLQTRGQHRCGLGQGQGQGHGPVIEDHD